LVVLEPESKALRVEGVSAVAYQHLLLIAYLLQADRTLGLGLSLLLRFVRPEAVSPGSLLRKEVSSTNSR
jgi:hypothetical protein